MNTKPKFLITTSTEMPFLPNSGNRHRRIKGANLKTVEKTGFIIRTHKELGVPEPEAGGWDSSQTTAFNKFCELADTEPQLLAYKYGREQT